MNGLFDPPQESKPGQYLVAHVDGGARGNPGPAGFGVVMRDEAGHKVAELSEYLGRQTNNYAEYSALLAAVNYALEHGHNALRVFSDSELMVKQIKGEFKVSNPVLKELHGKAQALIRQLDFFTINHVLREKNREADRLANLAMDRGMKKRANEAGPEPTPQPVTEISEVSGVVRNGVVVFEGQPLPEGTPVTIRAAKL